MADVHSPERRSRNMAAILGKDTKPELIVRQQLHGRGFRYRLHDRRLPGKPDLYFPKYEAAIFVNGCFWHRHNCTYFKWPSTRPEFWKEKLEGNTIRDEAKRVDLSQAGIRTLVVWECALKCKNSADLSTVVEAIVHWLIESRLSDEISGRSTT